MRPDPRGAVGLRRTAAHAVAAATLLGSHGPASARRWIDGFSGGRKLTALSRGLEVTARRRGRRFVLNLDDNAQRTFFYTGWYERPFLEFLRAEQEPGDVYVDIGGHIGMDAAVALDAGAEVVAFEASPDTAARLHQHLGGSARCTVVPLALGAEPGTLDLRADLRFDPNDPSVRSAYATGPVVFRVERIAFDDWAEQNSLARLDVVKLDIEGSEYDALRGMSRSLAALRPRMIAVEVNYRLLEAGRTAAELDELLGGFGYVRERTLVENVIFRRVAVQHDPGTSATR